MSILILRPNGDNVAGCSQSRSVGSYNHDCVDEETYDNTDYCVVSAASSPQRDHYDFPDHGTENGPISKVTVKAVSNYVASGGGSDSGLIILSARMAGIDYDDSGHSLTAAETLYSHDWTINPNTGNAWTWSEIDVLSAGCVLAAAGLVEGKGGNTYTNSFDYQFCIEVTYTAIISPSGISSTAAFGSPSLILKISPSGIASLADFGSPVIAFSGNNIYPQGIASLASVGVPMVINRQIISSDGIVPSAIFGSPGVTLRLQIISPAGIASVGVFGVPGLYMGHITCIGIPSVLAFGMPIVLRYNWHIIWEAAYEIDIPQVNRSFIVGEDLAGSLVTGNAIVQGEVDLVGERLEVQHTPAAITAAVAAGVAAVVLAKNRIDGKQGRILIPPHCALELWDVVNVVDAGANQSGSYRVSGYALDYDVRQGQYQQQLDLCAL
ncbi:MAG: hypothetical protein ACYDHZ_06990 [Dehalococcoidia bacterium]